MNQELPKYTYVVASADAETHWVLVVHDDSVDWYRRVATFTSRKRADDYADLENSMAADALGDEEWRKDLHAEDNTPVSAKLGARDPASNLIPGELVRRSTLVEHTRIEQHETSLANSGLNNSRKMPGISDAVENKDVSISDNPRQFAATNAPRPSEPVAATPEPVSEPCQEDVAAGNPPPTPEAAPPTGPEPCVDGERPHDEGHISEGAGGEEAPAAGRPQRPSPTLRDAASLPTLTPTQAAVFKGVRKLLTETKTYISGRAIAEAAGVQQGQVQTAMETLRRKGFIDNVGVLGAPDWVLLASGEPRVSAIGEGFEGWTPDQDALIKEVAKTGELSVSEISDRIGRTEGAVVGRFGKFNLYHAYQSARALRATSQVPAVSPPPASTPIENAKTPIENEDDEKVTPNDLTMRQVAVLRALCHKGFDTIPRLATDSGVQQKDLHLMLARLRFLELVGNFTPTVSGHDLMREIDALMPGDALPVKPTAPPTKVSFPVVKRATPTAPAAVKKPVNNSQNGQPQAYKAVEYLRKKGHRVVLNTWKNEWNVDGSVIPESEVLELVNKHRRKAEVPELPSLAAMT